MVPGITYVRWNTVEQASPFWLQLPPFSDSVCRVYGAFTNVETLLMPLPYARPKPKQEAITLCAALEACPFAYANAPQLR